VRLAGGLLVLSGMLVMLYNVVKTIGTASSTAPVPVPAAVHA
jgi:cbb3-type cytochrome oxidase subunit 1